MLNNNEQDAPKLAGTFKKLLLDLATSLLNATLLLLITLCTLILLIFYQVERISDDVAELTTLPSEITASLQDNAFLMQMERFRNNVALLNERLESDDPVIPPQDLEIISEQLTALELAVKSGFDQCSVELQQMIVMAIETLLRSGAQITTLPPSGPAL